MRVEEMIGQRIRARREELELSQSQLGQRLGDLLGREWPRQAVSAAERGHRAFTAAELVALAFSLGTSVSGLMTPHAGIADVGLSDSTALPRDAVVSAALPRLAGLATYETFAQLEELGTRLTADVLRASQALGPVTEDVRLINDQIKQAVEVITLRAQAVAEAPAVEAAAPAQQPVVAAIVTSSKGVLVGKRNDGKPPWTFIAGEVEPGELPEDAAVREVKEETGCLVSAGAEIGRRVHPKTGRTMIYMAAAPTHGTDVFVGDAEELAEVRWVSLAEANELMQPYGMFEPVREYLAYELGAGEQES